MAFAVDPMREELERQEEWQAREFAAEQEDKRRECDLKIAKLRYATQPRHKAVSRVLIAACKAPAWFILAFTLPKLARQGIAIPKALEDFLTV